MPNEKPSTLSQVRNVTLKEAREVREEAEPCLNEAVSFKGHDPLGLVIA